MIEERRQRVCPVLGRHRSRPIAQEAVDHNAVEAREAASLASYDIQKLREDSVERQALHNLLTAVDALINAVDGDGEAG